MAKPISAIQKHERTEEEEKQRKLDELTSLLTDNDAALNETLSIVRELHESGMLEAASSALKAREKMTEVAVGQLSREPVTQLINHVTSTAEALASIEPDTSKKLVHSIIAGLNEANTHAQHEKKLKMLDLVKALKDPDINRAVQFGLHVLKGMGKELK